MAKMQDLNWNDLRFVLFTARAKSFSAAAQALAVNETTVARRIALAENTLKARLFERNAGKLSLTQMGMVVVASAERVELEVQSIANQVTGADHLAAGTVRVTTVPLLLNHLLLPALDQLIERHPQLQLELIADSRDLSLTKREADIALRLARPSKESRVIARRIGGLDYAVYSCSTAQQQPWITYEDKMRDLPQASWINEQIDNGAQASPVLLNDAEGILAAVKQGLGKSLLPVVIADKEPVLKRLSDEVPESRELWLMVHPDLRYLTRVKVVMDWLGSLVAISTNKESAQTSE